MLKPVPLCKTEKRVRAAWSMSLLCITSSGFAEHGETEAQGKSQFEKPLLGTAVLSLRRAFIHSIKYLSQSLGLWFVLGNRMVFGHLCK